MLLVVFSNDYFFISIIPISSIEDFFEYCTTKNIYKGFIIIKSKKDSSENIKKLKSTVEKILENMKYMTIKITPNTNNYTSEFTAIEYRIL